MPPKTLYVTDLDGTLLDSDIKVPDAAVDMINRAIDSGALFTVATARTPGTLYRLLRDIRLNLPVIAMTGVTLWHPDTGCYSDTCYFSQDTSRKILDIYRRQGLPIFIYTLRDNLINVYHRGPLSGIERDFIAERAGNPFKRILIPTSGESDLPDDLSDIVLFFAMQPAGVGQAAYKALSETTGIKPMFYIDANDPDIAMIEAFPPGATKALAIRRLARTLGAERIVVFGDNRNDLPMFEIADLAVAVSNAIPEVLERADIIIGDHNSSAVAEFILSDFLSPNSPR